MTITQLEYVVAVATYKSFVDAAQKSFVTQPTLSMQIHKLEEELNVKIFDRNTHPISLTGLGEEIVQQAKVILAESNKMQEIVENNTGNISGDFKLAILPTLAPYLLPRLLNNYSKAYPHLRLEVSEMEINQASESLKNEEIDAALLSTPLEDSRLREYPVFYEPLVAFVGKDQVEILKKRMIEKQDIDLQKLWMLNEGNCIRTEVLNLCSKRVGRLQTKRPYKYESGNVETLRRMVELNGGITILPELSTFEFTEDQMEQVRYFNEQQPMREISLVTSGHFVRTSVLESLVKATKDVIPKTMRAATGKVKGVFA